MVEVGRNGLKFFVSVGQNWLKGVEVGWSMLKLVKVNFSTKRTGSQWSEPLIAYESTTVAITNQTKAYYIIDWLFLNFNEYFARKHT